MMKMFLRILALCVFALCFAIPAVAGEFAGARHRFLQENLQRQEPANSRQVHLKLVTKPVGVIWAAEGESTVTRPDNGTYPAISQSLLYLGDTIRTGKGASVQLVFLDNTAVKLGAKTHFSISDYQFDEREDKARASYVVSDGIFTFLAGKIAKMSPQNFSVETPTATIGIRGSGGRVWVHRAQGRGPPLRLVTMEGHVLVVRSFSGHHLVVDDPMKGLHVNAWGTGTPFSVPEPLNERAFAGQLSDSEAMAIRHRESLVDVVIALDQEFFAVPLAKFDFSTPGQLGPVTFLSLLWVQDMPFVLRTEQEQRRTSSGKKKKKGQTSHKQYRSGAAEEEVKEREDKEREISAVEEKERTTGMERLRRLGTAMQEKFRQVKKAVAEVFTRK